MPIEVVAGLIFQGNRLLVCQRKENGPFPLKWEFPGGKVEEGEEAQAALKRELQEELGIEICSAREIFRHRHRYAGQEEVEIVFFLVKGHKGMIESRSFHRILWAEIARLEELDFLEGDLALIEKLSRGELLA